MDALKQRREETIIKVLLTAPPVANAVWCIISECQRVVLHNSNGERCLFKQVLNGDQKNNRMKNKCRFIEMSYKKILQCLTTKKKHLMFHLVCYGNLKLQFQTKISVRKKWKSTGYQQEFILCYCDVGNNAHKQPRLISTMAGVRKRYI